MTLPAPVLPGGASVRASVDQARPWPGRPATAHRHPVSRLGVRCVTLGSSGVRGSPWWPSDPAGSADVPSTPALSTSDRQPPAGPTQPQPQASRRLRARLHALAPSSGGGDAAGGSNNITGSSSDCGSSVAAAAATLAAATVAAAAYTVVTGAAVPPGSLPAPGVAWSQVGNGVSSVRRSKTTSLREAWRTWLARVAQLIQYRLMMIFRLPTWGKMVALVMVGLPIVVIGSVLLRQATGLSWYEAAQYAFYVLQNVPGADITRFDQVQARVVLVVIHLMSLYTFATMVGLLTEDVRMTVEEIRSGNFPIPQRDHTVLLDASEDPQHLVSVLKQVMAARESRGRGVYSGCIAVLSTQPKDVVDKLITDTLPQQAGGFIVTRHGSPTKVVDLERVAAGHARTVLLLSPAGPMGPLSPSLQQELCLAALRSLQPPPPPLTSADPTAAAANATAAARTSAGAGGAGNSGGGGRGGSSGHRSKRSPRQRVVVETSTTVASSACRVVESDPDLDPLQVTYVSSASSAYRVAVQCAVQPGLAAVFDVIFCRNDDASLLVLDLPAHLKGRTFGDARRQFRFATLCGIVPSTHHHHHREQPDGTTGSSDGSMGSGSMSSSSGSYGSNGSMGSGESDADGEASSRGAGSGGVPTAIVFSPPDSRVLRQSDQLVLLGNRLADCYASLLHYEPPVLPALSPPYDGRRSMPRRIVVLSQNSRLEVSKLAALEEFCAPGCNVTIVSPQPCSGIPPGPTPRAGLRIRNEVGDPLSPGALLRADVVSADAVIMSGSDGLPEGESDATVMGTALLLQRLLADPDAMEAAAAAAEAAAAAAGVADGGAGAGYTSLSGSRPAEGGSSEEDDYWGTSSMASGNSVDFADWQHLSQLQRQVDDERRRERKQRRLPSKPLTFVCTLHDPQNRPVLQHIASTACRTAIATVAAAVGNYNAAAAAATAAAAGAAAGAADGATPHPDHPHPARPHVPLVSHAASFSSMDAATTAASHAANAAAHAAAAAATAATAAAAAAGSLGGEGPGASMGPAARGLSIEVVEPGAVISGMLAQVGADPRLVSGLEDLLDEQGCEIYIKRPDRYGLAPLTRLSWCQVCEVVRRAPGCDIALGYMHRGHLHLAPPSDTQLVLVAGDKLVVLSESFL